MQISPRVEINKSCYVSLLRITQERNWNLIFSWSAAFEVAVVVRRPIGLVSEQLYLNWLETGEERRRQETSAYNKALSSGYLTRIPNGNVISTWIAPLWDVWELLESWLDHSALVHRSGYWAVDWTGDGTMGSREVVIFHLSYRVWRILLEQDSREWKRRPSS